MVVGQIVVDTVSKYLEGQESLILTIDDWSEMNDEDTILDNFNELGE